MKFCKQYSEFIEREGQCKLPGCTYVQFKRFKKILKKCPARSAKRFTFAGSSVGTSHTAITIGPTPIECEQKNGSLPGANSCTCPACDGKFFPELLDEVSAIVGCFNVRARLLLRRHLAKGVRKYMLKLQNRLAAEHASMVEEGRTLLSYASINAMAIRKILKKYDKVHCAKAAELTSPKTSLLAKRVELLQSPWLLELCALHMNLSAKDSGSPSLSEGLRDFSFNFDNGNPRISCTLFDSVKMEVDLTCSICLEIVFDPVALKCGHVFCNSCACRAASVPSFLGIQAAERSAKCPLCRQEGGCGSAIHLPELSILVKHRCPEYWKERLRKERADQVLEAKAYWDTQLQRAMGL